MTDRNQDEKAFHIVNTQEFNEVLGMGMLLQIKRHADEEIHVMVIHPNDSQLWYQMKCTSIKSTLTMPNFKPWNFLLFCCKRNIGQLKIEINHQVSTVKSQEELPDLNPESGLYLAAAHHLKAHFQKKNSAICVLEA